MTEQSETPERAPNRHDVLIKLIDALYNLTNSGRIVGLVTLGVFLILAIVAWRLPAYGLNGHIGIIVSALSSNKFPFFILTISLGVSVTANIVQRRIYKKEIKRLVEERRQLIHGRQEGTLQPLAYHNESEFNLDHDEE